MSAFCSKLLRGRVAAVAVLLATALVSSASAQNTGGAIDPSQYTPNVSLYYGRQYPSRHVGATASVYDSISGGFVGCRVREIVCGSHGRLVVRKKRNTLRVRLAPGETILSIHYAYTPLHGKDGVVQLPLHGLTFPVVTLASLAGQVYIVKLESLFVEIYNPHQQEPPDIPVCAAPDSCE
jgi:hypothetical protein